MKQLDFIGIGDITTDAFIKLKDASVNCDINRENCQLCVRFGDKIPYDRVEVVRAVGNSPNASVSAARLGLSSGLVADVGDDQNGEECVETLREEKVSVEYINCHPGDETNYHYVLQFEEERTIFVKHHEYDYHFPEVTPPPKWMYLSSLAENSLPYHMEIADYLDAHPEVNLAFQPGTFQIKLGFEKLRRIYESSKIFFCNKEEAQRILNRRESDIPLLLEGMHNLGPRIVVITDGPKGAYAYDGKDMWGIPMYPDPKPPVDRTGAGDAFSSTFTVALALGKSIPEALSWGPVNSMSVVQYTGARAGLLTREQIMQYLVEAPNDYKAKKIN